MDLRLTPHPEGYAIRSWSPAAEEAVATFPTNSEAWPVSYSPLTLPTTKGGHVSVIRVALTKTIE